MRSLDYQLSSEVFTSFAHQKLTCFASFHFHSSVSAVLVCASSPDSEADLLWMLSPPPVNNLPRIKNNKIINREKSGYNNYVKLLSIGHAKTLQLSQNQTCGLCNK